MSSEWGDVGSESKELLGVATTRFTVGRSEISSNSHRPAAVTARAWVSYAALRHYGLTPTQVAESLGFRAKASCGVLSAPKHSLSTPTKSPARSGRDSLPPSTGTPRRGHLLLLRSFSYELPYFPNPRPPQSTADCALFFPCY